MDTRVKPAYDEVLAPMNLRLIILGLVIVVAAFVGATFLLNLLWPTSLQQGRPQLVAEPPLQPMAGTSTVLAPAAIAMTAIRDALEAQAPRNLSGKAQNPVSKLLSSADLNVTITRGPLNLSGRSDALVIATQLSGTLQALGTIASGANSVAGTVGNAVGNLIGGNVGQQVQNLA